MTGAFNSLVYLHQKYFYVFSLLYITHALYQSGCETGAAIGAALLAYAVYQVLPHRHLKSESNHVWITVRIYRVDVFKESN